MPAQKPAPIMARRRPAPAGPSRPIQRHHNTRLQNHTISGYSFKTDMRRILKRKDFTKWQTGEKLPDACLCKAVRQMESGLIDADLGGLLYKQRVARPGEGKSGGYRTLLSARMGRRYVFLFGFAKSNQANITAAEKLALQFAGEVFLNLSETALEKALQTGILMEVDCEQDH